MDDYQILLIPCCYFCDLCEAEHAGINWYCFQHNRQVHPLGWCSSGKFDLRDHEKTMSIFELVRYSDKIGQTVESAINQLRGKP